METQGWYQFDGFRVDARARTLHALATDTRVELQPRVFDALLLFVSRAGELLRKQLPVALIQASSARAASTLTRIESFQRPSR